MEPHEFRRIMIEKIRAFEKWAWEDIREMGGDVRQEYHAWLEKFKEFVE